MNYTKAIIILTAVFMAEPSYPKDQTLLGLPPVPESVVKQQTPEKIALGKKLFSDTRFSSTGLISCASCHDKKKMFSDGLAVAEGVHKQKGTRNTPSLINVVFNTSQFWDGRRISLEEQANDPFVNAIEHGLPDLSAVMAVVYSDKNYLNAFKQVFGGTVKRINMGHVTQALAAFERTLVAGNSAFDRFEYGGNHAALTPAAQRGLALFRGRAGCVTCHIIDKKSALFLDNRFHISGVGFERIQSRLTELTAHVMQVKGEKVAGSSSSLGRAKLDNPVFTELEISELGRFVVSGNPSDIGKFKTPSLRNVALTAPYMHNGMIASLKDVIEIELYVRGGEGNRPVIVTPSEKNDLVEFLQSLTSAQLTNSTD